MNSDELTPEERMILAEGRSLEEEVKNLNKGGKEESPLLGVDGKPLEKDAKVAEGIISTEDTAAEAHKKAIVSARKKVEENAKKITDIIDKNDTARYASESVLCAYKLLFFALNDLGTFEGMTNELLEQVSDSMRAASMQTGVNIHDLRHAILGGKCKHPKTGKSREFGTVFYLKERIAYYAAESRKRKTAISAIQRRIGDKGIALPCHSLRQMYPEKPFFTAGSMIVLHGKPAAVRMALRHCAFAHQTKNRGEPFYLSSDRKKQSWDEAFKVMPLAWWKNAAATDHKLMETFQSVVYSSSLLLVMEGLTHLWAPEKYDKDKDWERRARALAKLYQWASENMVAVIVGDFTAGPVEERTYGNMPHIAVTIGKPEGETEAELFIGTDMLPLITEE